MDLVQLAMPRRVYTQSHADRVAEAFEEVHAARHDLKGLRIVEPPRFMRPFTARSALLG